jgi:putative addiction module CopG family antidote
MPRTLKSMLDQQMERGGFENASEYVRHLIRSEEERFAPEWLEQLIEEGLRSPKLPLDEAWVAERQRRVRERLART